jgi:hypothetical protein
MKKRNQVRKNSANAIICHPSYVAILKAGKILGLINHISIRMNIPNAMHRKVNNTINLLGGVHAIFFSHFILLENCYVNICFGIL